MGTARAVVVTVILTLGAVACGSNGAPPAATGEGANQGAAGDTATQGGGGSQGADLTDLDVCTLLSREEIQSAVGNAVDEGTSLPLVCNWDSNTLEDVAVTLGVFPDFPGTTVEPCEAARDPEAVAVGSGADRRRIVLELPAADRVALARLLGGLQRSHGVQRRPHGSRRRRDDANREPDARLARAREDY